MSLDTYANLKTAVADWLHRADVTASAGVVDDALDMVEAWANRNLRTRWQEGEATADATEYLELPTDFVEMRDIQWQGSPRVNLEYVTPEWADGYDTSGATNIPRFYTQVGNQIRLIPAPSSTTSIRMSYWKSISALSGTNTTNWLLTSHPDFYLYGTLWHLHAYIFDEMRAQMIRDGWAAATAEVQRAGKRGNVGGSLTQRAA